MNKTRLKNIEKLDKDRPKNELIQLGGIAIKNPSVDGLDLTDPSHPKITISGTLYPSDVDKIKGAGSTPVTYIPVDKRIFPQYLETFNRRITPSFTREETKDEEGEKIITYTTPTKGGELTYRFYEKVISKELGQDATRKLPSLGRRASKLWFSMIYFAKKQGKGMGGNFTASELMRLWGGDPEKRGKLWGDIRETFFNIVAVSPSYTNKRSGDERTDWGFAFTSSYLIKGEGKESRYHYTMTPEALGLTEKWLKGELTAEVIKNKGGYLAYPLAYLQGGLDETEQNFRDYLLKFKGGYSVKAFTILNDWLKLRRDLLRRPTYCHQLLYTLLENAKGRGEISSYKFEVRGGLKDWRNKWKVTIYKPTAENKAKTKQRRGSKTNTAEQENLIDTIFEWQSRPIQGIKKPPKELKKQITNTVKAYGVGAVREIYNRTANGATPSTYSFWQEIKKLKREAVHKIPTQTNTSSRTKKGFKRVFQG